MWRDIAQWSAERDIVHALATEAGRDPASIENAIPIEKPLPQTDEESEASVELLAGGTRQASTMSCWTSAIRNRSSSSCGSQNR
jgi:hypothetical protein